MVKETIGCPNWRWYRLSKMALLTRQEAAAELKIGLRTLDRRLATGQLKCYRLGSGPRAPIRISVEQLLEYLENVNSADHADIRDQAQKILE